LTVAGELADPQRMESDKDGSETIEQARPIERSDYNDPQEYDRVRRALVRLGEVADQLFSLSKNLRKLNSNDIEYMIKTQYGSEIVALAREGLLPPTLRQSIDYMRRSLYPPDPIPVGVIKDYVGLVESLHRELEPWKPFYLKQLIIDSQAFGPLREQVESEERRLLHAILFVCTSLSGGFVVWDLYRRHEVSLPLAFAWAYAVAIVVGIYVTDGLRKFSRFEGGRRGAQ
jgi:hypothetical protein